MTTITINPLKVIPAPWNTRSATDINSLAASIEADGIISPPSVFRDCDGDYICFDGNRRVAAACQLGLAEITVTVHDITEAEAKIKTVTANLQREDDDPLLAAKVIAECLDNGETAEIIADKLGKTTSWVNRRRKLLTLTDEMKEVAPKCTMECLERVAALPEAAQKKLVKAIESRARYTPKVGAADIRYDIERESMDLDCAKFCTKECKKCLKRTGAEADLFGVVKGLGRCLDCKCFKQKAKEREEKLIADATKGVDEVVRVQYAYNVPDEAKAEKPSKKNPCAYVVVDYNGDVKVTYGPSKKAIEAQKAKEDEERKANREAEAAERERSNEINLKLSDWAESDEGEASIRTKIRKLLGGEVSETADWIIDSVYDRINAYNFGEDSAKILRAFPDFAEEAGITDDDAKWFIDRYITDDDYND